MRVLHVLGTGLAAGLLTACSVLGVSVSPGLLPAPGPASASPRASDLATPSLTTSVDPLSRLPWIGLADLPSEGRQVYLAIRAGGPFVAAKDGSTFLNAEGLLPRYSRGYYREYTVPTPGTASRGARRIVCGGLPVTSVAECYYTADHYQSFRRIRG